MADKTFNDMMLIYYSAIKNSLYHRIRQEKKTNAKDFEILTKE